MSDDRRPKRFYTRAEAAAGEGGFRVELDGRPIRTPGRNLVAVPSRDTAEALAAEWAAQGERVDPMTMPLTRLVNSALDGVARDPRAVADEIVRYAGSDLLCYRAEAPERLVDRQTLHWDPVLDWARDTLGARFILTQGIIFVDQPPSAVAAVDEALPADPLRLAALNLMTTLSGSALLALAVWHGLLSPEAAWAAAHVDEDVQIEMWGEDAEAMERRAARWRDFSAAAALLRQIGGPEG
ncbi:ATP12 family protein [Bosea sp. 117]|uniref:ATP12 family chaperone protein n=1 Tax=Bosea sp. 117 TaxID=1125973 RepID=UPI000B0E201B|nr:ATP12 family protein [Bosea sp. 117]